MEITIRNIGNSKGVVLPKPLLAQVGLEGAATAVVAVENNAIVLRKPAVAARAGWSDAAARVAGESSGDLLMGEFGNTGDEELVW